MRRERVDQQLDAELHVYVDLVVIEKVADGADGAQARAAALAQLGGIEQVKAEVRKHRALAAALGAVEQGRASLRSSLHVFCGTRATVATAVVLTVGIAANVALANLAQLTGSRLARQPAATVTARVATPSPSTSKDAPSHPNPALATRVPGANSPAYSPSSAHRVLKATATARHQQDSAMAQAVAANGNADHRDGSATAVGTLPDPAVPLPRVIPPL